MSIKGSYTFLASLFACLALTSCIDDDLTCDDYGIPKEITDGYSLNLTLTLDNMGGTRAESTPQQLKDMEDYIDPEKLRILFFNNQEQFLFESKSRWVKQLAPLNGQPQWLVSVPMFDYGNDIDENWDWDAIRTALMSDNFKIAILANRLDSEWYPGFKDTGLPSTAALIDNTGPHWKREHTVWGATDPKNIKKIFDLHHCQYDPIYHGKCVSVSYNTKDRTDAQGNKVQDEYGYNVKDTLGVTLTDGGYYDFIMDGYDRDENGEPLPSLALPKELTENEKEIYAKRRPQMGATSSWVEWDVMDDDGHVVGESHEVPVIEYDPNWETANGAKNKDLKVRYSILPSKKHPIPMYGMQNFDKIEKWVKGTPFNLSKIITDSEEEKIDYYTFKSIALLRSVVKLELKIPKSYNKPEFVSMWYSNLYARCEPLNVWDPTDELWEKESPHLTNCEWLDIMNYGPICSINAKYNRYGTTKEAFQEVSTWFYGAWEKHGWKFTDHGYKGGSKADDKSPNIFNPCIQRHKMILCSKEGDVSSYYNDDYWHFVVYTGERNMIDPNTLPQLSGSAYSVLWSFSDKIDDTKSNYYYIPVADYGDNGSRNRTAINCFGPYNKDNATFVNGTGTYQLPYWNAKRNGTTGILYYGNTIKGGESNSHVDANLQIGITDVNEMPWPLLRNHVYTITIGGPTTRSEDDGMPFTVTSEDHYSESLKVQ